MSRMDEYISKQRAKDLMGCCLASAKANYKDETSVFKKEQFKHYAETIEAMIDVVGAVEAADVQPVKRGRWIKTDKSIGVETAYACSECEYLVRESDRTNYCGDCGARMDLGDEKT